MRADRTRPVRYYNRRCRRLAQAFEVSLRHKEHREERREAFEAQYAPLYRDYGKRVEDADRARAIRDADEHAFLAGREVEIVDGRIVLVTKR